MDEGEARLGRATLIGRVKRPAFVILRRWCPSCAEEEGYREFEAGEQHGPSARWPRATVPGGGAADGLTGDTRRVHREQANLPVVIRRCSGGATVGGGPARAPPEYRRSVRRLPVNPPEVSGQAGGGGGENRTMGGGAECCCQSTLAPVCRLNHPGTATVQPVEFSLCWPIPCSSALSGPKSFQLVPETAHPVASCHFSAHISIIFPSSPLPAPQQSVCTQPPPPALQAAIAQHSFSPHCMRPKYTVEDLHKKLVLGFFRNAIHLLLPSGEIHITLQTEYPYFKWKLKKLASRYLLKQIECANFVAKDYPGYKVKRGGGRRSNNLDVGCNHGQGVVGLRSAGMSAVSEVDIGGMGSCVPYKERSVDEIMDSWRGSWTGSAPKSGKLQR
ncbi:hypothetical protein KSP39_PZI018748 [Platanthera zijinensis]|uniref:25S rRNA (uridine-N(3))-methyltransferase BMT5-like domain-containing protein n=1 Tax=Platanthera zijinensis TaxID=2320716 RepID=A0AAP0FYV0_9ASPA